MNKLKHKILLFLISPFLSLYIGLTNFYSKSVRILLLCFFLFYSVTYIPIPNSDATRYEERVQNADKYSFSEYSKEIKNMYSSKSQYHDAYVPTLLFIMTPFTNNIAVFRLLVGFFYFSTYFC